MTTSHVHIQVTDFISTRQASTKLQIRIIESLWEIDIILTKGATIHSCIL